MSELNKKIVKIRTRESLSQAKFAESLGFSQGYVADIECGRTKPSRNFLEALSRVYNVNMDWVLAENLIIRLIDNNKTINPKIIFIYTFIRPALEERERMLKRDLKEYKLKIVDATGLTSSIQLTKKILDIEKNIKSYDLDKKLKDFLLNDENVLVIKTPSLSKIPSSAEFIRSIFKILDDAWLESNDENNEFKGAVPKSTIIILDFASYLEKNMDVLEPYVVPIYTPGPDFGWVI